MSKFSTDPARVSPPGTVFLYQASFQLSSPMLGDPIRQTSVEETAQSRFPRQLFSLLDKLVLEHHRGSHAPLDHNRVIQISYAKPAPVNKEKGDKSNYRSAGLVAKAEDRPWLSLGLKRADSLKKRGPKISDWPVPRPSNWSDFVNQAMTAKELERLRSSAQRGQPYGNESWQRWIAQCLGLESTLHARGRPKKSKT